MVSRQGGLRVVHEAGAHAQGVGAPPTLVVASGLFWPTSGTPWASFGPKIISVKFQLNWTPFGFPFLQNTKRKNKNSHWALG